MRWASLQASYYMLAMLTLERARAASLSWNPQITRIRSFSRHEWESAVAAIRRCMRAWAHTDDEDGAPEGQSDPGVENCVSVHHPLNQKRQFRCLNVHPRAKINSLSCSHRFWDQSRNESSCSFFTSVEPEELENPAAIQREEVEISWSCDEHHVIPRDSSSTRKGCARALRLLYCTLLYP